MVFYFGERGRRIGLIRAKTFQIRKIGFYWREREMKRIKLYMYEDIMNLGILMYM